MRLTPTIGALFLLFLATPAWAPPVAFSPVTALPIPLQSVSGLFNSFNPPNRHDCPYSKVSGRVVSAHLIMVHEMACGQAETGNVLVNVDLSKPADTMQMVVGRTVAVKAKFKRAEERRDNAPFDAFFLIAENAELLAGDPLDRAAPAPAFMSYMLCQPPELDALAARLGRDLCVQSTILATLPATAPALETAARAPMNMAPTDIVSGDPNAITCRMDLENSALHLRAIACARGSYWGWYREKWRDRSFVTPAPP